MITVDRTFTLGVMAFVLDFLAIGVWHYDYGWTILRFPVLAGVTVCLIGIGNLAMTARIMHAGDSDDTVQTGLRPAISAMAWIGAALPMVLLLGYVIGLPLYIFIYLKSHGQGWRVSAVLAAVTFVVVYGGFVTLLAIPLQVLPMGL